MDHLFIHLLQIILTNFKEILKLHQFRQREIAGSTQEFDVFLINQAHYNIVVRFF